MNRIIKIIKWIALALVVMFFGFLFFSFLRRSELMNAGEVLINELNVGNIEGIYNQGIMLTYNDFKAFEQVIDLYGLKGAEFVDWIDYSTKGKYQKVSVELDLIDKGEASFTFFFEKIKGDLEFIDVLRIVIEDEK